MNFIQRNTFENWPSAARNLQTSVIRDSCAVANACRASRARLEAYVNICKEQGLCKMSLASHTGRVERGEGSSPPYFPLLQARCCRTQHLDLKLRSGLVDSQLNLWVLELELEITLYLAALQDLNTIAVHSMLLLRLNVKSIKSTTKSASGARQTDPKTRTLNSINPVGCSLT